MEFLLSLHQSVNGPNVWSGRALQEVFIYLANAVLHQCIRPPVGACCAPGHHGYQRACDLIKRQASTGQVGHQCSHAPGRPILHRRLILSQTSAGKLTTSSIAPHFALFLCSCLAAVPSSRPAGYRRAARRGRQGWPSRLSCPSCPPAARPRLDGPEHGARITLDRTRSHRS